MVDQLVGADQSVTGAPVVAVRGRLRSYLPDIAWLGAVFGAFFAVNDLSMWMTAPYWQDEAWVALSTRVPLSDLPQITSSTPLGWSLLLRLVADPGSFRLVPLAFALIAVVAAYALGRLLPWRTRVESMLAGAACAGAVVLLPAQQLRHDLKQYTADAAVTLALLAATAWLERSWSRRRVAAVAALAPVAFLVSQATLIVAVATFAGLMVGAAARRDRRRFIEATVAGAASGLALLILFLVLVEPNRNETLRHYWDDFYPSPSQLPGYLGSHLRPLGPSAGFRHLAIPVFAVLGVAALLVKRRVATMAAFVGIPALLVALGVARTYPLLDQRTSYFLFAAGAALAGIGVLGAATYLARFVPRGSRPVWRIACSAALALVALGAFAVDNRAWYRFDGLDSRVPDSSPIALTDVRSQVRWVDAHRAPGDVVIVSVSAIHGYAFYHDDKPMAWQPSAADTGWSPIIGDENVVVVGAHSAPAIQNAVDRAVARARSNGPDARLLLIRTWWWGEKDAWTASLRPYAVNYPYTGTDPVAVVTNL
ncbi:hypothetical protein [Dactylosporangium sp. CA-092794]|uniref:hypothetical protein n=1 Tax=Dactylosporangium sp. CA-092794 TaxID=3239929 RepID=UPI003D908358